MSEFPYDAGNPGPCCQKIEDEVMTTEELAEDMPPAPDYDPEEWERKRKEEWEAKLAPYKAASGQRKESAGTIAEHDELLADMLFEMTMNEIEDE